MGHQVSPSTSDDEFIDTWKKDRPGAPPLPKFAVRALRESLMNRQSPLANGHWPRPSHEEAQSFASDGDFALGTTSEEAPRPGWWRRFARAGSSGE